MGFGVHSQSHSIATTLVSMPNDEILKNNLEVVTTPRTAEDRKLYQEIIEIFRSNLNGKRGHWEGEELLSYKKAIAKC